MTLPLSSPPGFEYTTRGPWFIVQIFDDDHSEAWVMHTFESAILRFWYCPTTPIRRVMVDSMGVTILGTDSTDMENAIMSGTRQAADATLALVAKGSDAIEDQLTVLAMIDGLQSLNGQAIQ